MAKLVPSQDIILLSSNVTNLDYAPWDVNTAYNTEEKVSIAEDGKNYYATKNIAAGVKPDPEDEKGLLTGWFSETSNKYAMFDHKQYTQTVNQDSIDFSYNATNIDTIAFYNLDANEIHIKMTDITTNIVVYDKIATLSYNEISLYNYFFVRPELKTKLITKLEGTDLENKIDDIVDALNPQEAVDRYTVNPPLYFYVKVEISIKKTGSKAKCGNFISGQSIDLGMSLWRGGEIKTKTFGVRSQDNYWGNYTLKKGEIVDLVTIPVLIDTNTISYTRSILKRYAYDYCLFIGDETQSIPDFTVFGLAQNTSMLPLPQTTQYSLKVGSII